ncbi:MAG TPA: cysteine desulfurase [Gammaproteobacteria bacterium]|jgi:cysteine desulfurase/selenocysteine lyase|nr:cysteine desulfurase [Gammaproteobacteria bacterium]
MLKVQTGEQIDFCLLHRDFPALRQLNRGKPIVYLDSAASAQKPRQVVEAISHFYLHDYANIHRGIYELSERATQRYEAARQAIKGFIHAGDKNHVIFVRSTTEAINFVAQSYGRTHWQAGDEVILNAMEHHSNIVPWLLLKEQIGIVIKTIPITDEGALDMAVYPTLFTPRTKLVAVSHASNVLGTINPIKEMAAIAHAHQALIFVDGAQAVPHFSIDVQDLDCDFYAFSGHKLYGPTGIGVLYAKQAMLDEMPPYHGGGGMIETVALEDHVQAVTYLCAPHKFEAGTPDIAGAVGLHAAIDYLQTIGMENISAHEQCMLHYAEKALSGIPGLRLIGTAKPKVSVLSFVVDGIHPHDVGTVLDHEGIAIRAGHHCAMPLMQRFQVPATVRASLGVYNTTQDIAALVEAILLAKRLFAR